MKRGENFCDDAFEISVSEYPSHYATFNKINTDKKVKKVKFCRYFVTNDYQQMIFTD